MKKLILIFLMCSVTYAADTKLTDLTLLGSAACSDDELIYVVDDPNGTPVSRKIARYEFLLGWGGSTNITTLGTVTTGVWNAGAVTSSGTVEGATITEGGAGVPNLDEIDWVAAAEMADADHGDVAWSGGAAEVQSATVNDAATITYYVGLWDSDTGSNVLVYTDTELAYTEATGTLAATVFSGSGASLTSLDGEQITADTIDDDSIDFGSGADQVDLADIPGGTAGANAFDFGGADLEIPQASPAVPGVDGGIELDFTDGTMVIQHGAAHAELGGATDVVFGRLIKSCVNDVLTVKAVNSIQFPHGVVITAIYLGISSDTGYVLTVQNFDD
jgi:hypothetical protein